MHYRLGWYGDIEKKITASYLDCVECHEEDMRDKAEAEAIDELGLNDYDPSDAERMDMQEFDLP